MLIALIALAYSFNSSAGGDSWIVVRGDSGNVAMSGSMADVAEARKCLRDAPAGCLWIRRAGRRYVSTDPAALRQIADAQKPQEALGEKQAALGEEQAALGEQQAQLGGRQAELGLRQARDPEQASLGRDQDALARKQAELGEKQAALGKKQEELGRQQARLAKEVERTVGRLIDALIESGKAIEIKG